MAICVRDEQACMADVHASSIRRGSDGIGHSNWSLAPMGGPLKGRPGTARRSYSPTSRPIASCGMTPHTGECTEFRTGTHGTNGLMFDAQGRLYGCQSGNHCIARFEPDGTMTPLPNRLQGHRHNRPNDLAVDRKGRIWFTDPFGRGRSRRNGSWTMPPSSGWTLSPTAAGTSSA